MKYTTAVFRSTLIPVLFISLAMPLAMPLAAGQPTTEDIAGAIAAIKKVEAHGKGHDDAVKAMQTLNKASVDQIPEILEGMDGANKLATNWLRSAVVSISSRADKVPADKIRSYFDDKSNGHLGRLLAFDLLSGADDGFAEKMIPQLVDDPSLPLRSKAIKDLFKRAESAEGVQSVGLLATAVDKARDVNQVIFAAQLLKKKGVAIDLQEQLGFINQWQLVGNFDNKEGKGFDVVHGPEKSLAEIDLDAEYDSVDGKSKWQSHTTSDNLGLVDLNKVIGKVKGVTVYAYATYDCDEDREVDVRLGCINAHKIWVNGEVALSNDINHNGISPDKFVGKAKMKKGENKILVKVCQNEQTQGWAQRWQFQLRICDETGKALAPPEPEQERPGS